MAEAVVVDAEEELEPQCVRRKPLTVTVTWCAAVAADLVNAALQPDVFYNEPGRQHSPQLSLDQLRCRLPA